MGGISPRYVVNRLSSALVKDGTTCINPLDALRALKDGLEQHTSIARDEKEQYQNFIYEARKEYDELAKNEIQKAFGLRETHDAGESCSGVLPSSTGHRAYRRDKGTDRQGRW